MALKSIIDIEINDEQFKAFKNVFGKFQDDVKKMPGSWANIDKSISQVNISILTIEKNTKKTNSNLNKSKKNIDSIFSVTGLISSSFSTIGKYSGKVLSNITKATGQLIKWGTITSAFALLIGGGGTIFGIERLASKVASTRRNALGIGASYGQVQSANANLNRLINPQTLLENVSTGKYDYTSDSYIGLRSAGISQDYIKGHKTGEISLEFLKKLEPIFKNVDKGLYGSYAKSMKLDQVMPLNDIIAFLNAQPEEKERMIKQAEEDNKNFDLTEKAQRKWQDLITQLSRSGKLIETGILEKFSKLEPGLEKLSIWATDQIVDFINSDTMRDWITGVSGGLESFANTLNDDKTNDKIKEFIQWVEDAGIGLLNFANAFGDIFGKPSNGTSNPDEVLPENALRDPYGDSSGGNNSSADNSNDGSNESKPQIKVGGNPPHKIMHGMIGSMLEERRRNRLSGSFPFVKMSGRGGHGKRDSIVSPPPFFERLRSDVGETLKEIPGAASSVGSAIRSWWNGSSKDVNAPNISPTSYLNNNRSTVVGSNSFHKFRSLVAYNSTGNWPSISASQIANYTVGPNIGSA